MSNTELHVIDSQQNVIGYSLAPIGGIAMSQNGKQFKYEPKDDIKPIEVARIAELFVCSSVMHIPADYIGFIEKHGLQRHFEEVK